MPILPEIQYRMFPPNYDPKPNYPVTQLLSNTNKEAAEEFYVTDGNRLYIPKIGVDSKILEGSTLDVLSEQEGVWREPNTAKPNDSIPGNMVIAGHRFQYLPPNRTTFYNLNKLKTNDNIQVYWDGKVHHYEIYKIFEVEPDQVEVRSLETDSEGSEITLYTCTPIFSSKKRLVVKAREIYNKVS